MKKTIPYGPVSSITVEIDPAYDGHVLVWGPHRNADPQDTTRLMLLSSDEAQQLLEALDDALNFDPTPYVQVSYLEGVSYRRYTYRDVSGTLEVGDIVEVPVGTTERSKLAKVVALGKGDYTGTPRDVTAKLSREEIVA